ncbi:MAG TPA: TonB-dependent receptor, partial [Polyangiales bacterium]
PSEPTPPEAAPPAAVPAEVPPVEALPVEAPPVERVPMEPAVEVASAPPPAPPETIEVTVVGTSLSRTAGSAHVIGKKQLERFEYDDPTAALLSTPGLYVRTEDGMGLRPNIALRGVNPDRSKKITLLEDGVLFGPAPYSAPAGYYFPLLTRMTKIKVIKGPAAIGYGPQTVAGVIDFTTREIPDDTAAYADVAVGQYGYGKANAWAGMNNGKFGFLIEGTRIQNNGFKELIDSAGRDADTGFIRDEWMVKASYTHHGEDLTNEVKLKLTYADETSNESYLGLTDADFRQNPNRRYSASQLDRMHNHRVSAVLTHTLTSQKRHLSLVTNVYRHDFQRTWRKVNGFPGTNLFDTLNNPTVGRNPTYVAILRGQQASANASQAILIGPNERNFISQGVESRLNWSGKTGPISHRVEAGLRYHNDYIDRHHSQSAFLVDGVTLTPVNEYPQTTAYNKESTHAVAMHASYAASWKELTITPGVRTELISSRSKDRLEGTNLTAFNAVVLPGVGVYQGIWRGLGILGGVYEGFSPPPPGSAKSKPEKSINYEAGARYTQRLLRAETVFFYNDYKNLTDICTESSGCTGAAPVNGAVDPGSLNQQYNAGAVRTYGMEVFLEHEIPINVWRVPVGVAYTWTKSFFESTFTSPDPIFGSVQRGYEMPYVPRNQVRLTAGVEHPRGSFNTNFTYVGREREIPGRGSLDDTIATDAQTLVDIAASAKIWGPLSLYANCFNLFDKQYIVARRPFGARPNAPRWVHVGIKASY